MELAFGLNVPAPPLHMPVLAPPVIVPRSTASLPAHTVWSAPALTVTEGLMVTTIWSDTDGHAPGGSFVVSVSMAEPAVTCTEEGVKVAFSVFGFGEKVPPPVAVQVKVEMAEPTDPDNVALLPAQICWSGPALTVALLQGWEKLSAEKRVRKQVNK